ncbi:MAG: CPBP family intramembrane glutamic endopeptidase [archaeon]
MYNKNLLKIGFIYFSSMVLFVGLRIAYNFGFLETYPSFIFNIITQIGIMFIFPILLILILYKKPSIQLKKTLNFKKITLKSMVPILILTVLIFFLGVFISLFFSALLNFLGFSYNALSNQGTTTLIMFLQSLLFSALLPGIFEEIMHRGFLLNNLSVEIGYRRTIIITSILFGLIHLNILQSLSAAFIGAIIAVVTIVSSSIIPAIIIHTLYNSIVTYLSFAQSQSLWGDGFYDGINYFLQNNHPSIVFATSFILLTIIFTLIGLSIVYLFRQNTLSKISNVRSRIQNALKQEVFEDKRQLDEKEISVINDVLKKIPAANMPDIKNINSTMDLVFPVNEKDNIKLRQKDMIFIYGAIFLGFVITLMTFIWGIL